MAKSTVFQSKISWRPSWRIVSSLFPPQGVFDRVARPEDLEVVMAIEGLTNDRLRQEAGEISLVPEKERISGPGTTPIMAAFTHPSPSGSRFADSTFGVYYAANTIDTAIAETQYHKERFLRATNEPPIEIDMRSYASNVEATFDDLRGQEKSMPELFDPDPDNYGAAQLFAKSRREVDSNGIVYNSVRDQGGECVAVFKPNLLSPVRQGKHFCYVWNGFKISSVYTKAKYKL